jgi:ferredoxin
MGKAFNDKEARRNSFLAKVRQAVPKGGNLDLCLTCGACVSGCPATGLEDMDPRKFLRLAVMGLDDLLTSHKLGLDVLDVYAVHLCLPDADQYRRVDHGGTQPPVATGGAASGYPPLLRHGPEKSQHQRHRYPARGLSFRGRGCFAGRA